MSASDPGASSDPSDFIPCPYCLIPHKTRDSLMPPNAEDCVRALGLAVFALRERVQDLEHKEHEREVDGR